MTTPESQSEHIAPILMLLAFVPPLAIGLDLHRREARRKDDPQTLAVPCGRFRAGQRVPVQRRLRDDRLDVKLQRAPGGPDQ
jgi:hypothetical protein